MHNTSLSEGRNGEGRRSSSPYRSLIRHNSMRPLITAASPRPTTGTNIGASHPDHLPLTTAPARIVLIRARALDPHNSTHGAHELVTGTCACAQRVGACA
jgi:hypothetical protein